MPGIEERKKYVHVRVNPPDKYIRMRTKDIGRPGGMKAVIGVRRGKGSRGGTTEVQKFELDRRDVGVRNGKLYPKTPRGRREIRSLGGARARKRRSLGARLLSGY